MKTINFKIDEKELARLNYYRSTSEGGNTAQADFIKQAIESECDKVRHLRQGGLLMTFPNPDNFIISEEKKATVLEILKEADLKLARVAPGISLTEMIAYYQDHFMRISDRKKQEFKENMITDSTYEETLYELKI